MKEEGKGREGQGIAGDQGKAPAHTSSKREHHSAVLRQAVILKLISRGKKRNSIKDKTTVA